VGGTGYVAVGVLDVETNLVYALVKVLQPGHALSKQFAKLINVAVGQRRPELEKAQPVPFFAPVQVVGHQRLDVIPLEVL